MANELPGQPGIAAVVCQWQFTRRDKPLPGTCSPVSGLVISQTAQAPNLERTPGPSPGYCGYVTQWFHAILLSLLAGQIALVAVRLNPLSQLVMGRDGQLPLRDGRAPRAQHYRLTVGSQGKIEYGPMASRGLVRIQYTKGWPQGCNTSQTSRRQNSGRLPTFCHSPHHATGERMGPLEHGTFRATPPPGCPFWSADSSSRRDRVSPSIRGSCSRVSAQ